MWALRLGGAGGGKVAVLSGEAIVCAIKQRKKRRQYIASVWVLFLPSSSSKKKMILGGKNFGQIEPFFSSKERIILELWFQE